MNGVQKYTKKIVLRDAIKAFSVFDDWFRIEKAFGDADGFRFHNFAFLKTTFVMFSERNALNLRIFHTKN